MSDLHVEISLTRGEVVDMLTNSPEHLLFVISAVLSCIAADDVIEAGELHDNTDIELVVFNLGLISRHISRQHETTK